MEGLGQGISPQNQSHGDICKHAPGLGGVLWLPKKSQHPAADTRFVLCTAKHPKLAAVFGVERVFLQVPSSDG